MYQSGRLKNKIKALDDLRMLVQKLKEQGKKVVFTNGCFDLIHAGHVRVLEEAKKLGDLLIVALNSDHSIRTLKGVERPVIPQQQRAEVIAALESVDYVVIFNEPDPLKVIKGIEPHILVKGGDWHANNIVGREIVESSGGSIISVPLMDGVSTTNIISKIKNL